MSLTVAQLKTLDRLLQQALDLPEGERLRWLDTLQPEFAPLAGILRTQLGAGPETGQFLGELPRLGVFDLPGQGERIGPYRLVRLLGEGGMGSVWLAERADGSLNRDVALKLPHRHLLDRGLVERMRRERDFLAALSHDHIARLYDAGIDEQGRPYLALEYVAGTPIDAYCSANHVDLSGRVRLLLQVARAVAHAHASLVVHRDLKPRNVLVTVADGVPCVKLLDFGIAKLLTADAPAAGEADLTHTLGRALTPDYASPEQILDQPLTTATDVYSLGVLTYELVTGEKPYKLKRRTPGALAEAIVNADIVRPSRRLAARGDPRAARRVAGDLDAVILKAMRPESRERYPTASALADDLERYLAHRAVEARPDRWLHRARRFARRNAIATAAAVVVSITLVAGTGISLWQAREARIEAAKTKAVKDFLVGILSAGVEGHEAAAARSKRAVGDVLMDAARVLPGKLNDQPEVKEELLGTLGDLLENLLLSQAAARVREARVAALDALGAPLVTRMIARNDLGYSLGGAGDKARAGAIFDEVIAALEGTHETYGKNALAFALTQRAMIRNAIASGKGAADDAARAVRLMETVSPGSNTHVYTLIALGAAHAVGDNIPEADAAFSKALPLARQLPGSEAAIEATAHSHLARSHFARREYARAEHHATQAMLVIERFSGRESFTWARNAIYPGAIRGMRGDIAGAAALLEPAVKTFASMGADISPEFASMARGLLAQALLEYGQVAEARVHAEAAFEPYRQVRDPGAFPQPALRARVVLAEVLLAEGRYREAAKLLEGALALAASPGHQRSVHAFQARHLAAVNAAHLGDLAGAEAALVSIIADDVSRSERFGAPRHHASIALAQVWIEGGQLARAAGELAALARLVEGLDADERATSGMAAARVASLQGALAHKQGERSAAAVHFRRALAILEPRQDPRSPQLAQIRQRIDF